MDIRIGKTERGYEMEYRFLTGPWAFGPESESTVYATYAAAQEALMRERAEYRAWESRDAPHSDAF